MKTRKAAVAPLGSKWIAVAVIVIAAAAGVTFAVLSRQAESPPAAAQPVESAAPATAQFEPTHANDAAPPGPAPEGMVWIPGGEFSMGAVDPLGQDANVVGMQATTDSRPVHRVYVDGFWMERTEVTNREFAKFVDATGYVTVAERTPTAEEFPGAPPENLVAGSVVFAPPDHAVPLDDHFQWWAYVRGANWRHPEGPGSDLKNREQYPVLHLAYEDVEAYAKWAGKR
ncbi:MAG: SUMF1/EgtB/PvdO family nonheme iron enzyme, partial [Steroidobacteraceae bacterium]